MNYFMKTNENKRKHHITGAYHSFHKISDKAVDLKHKKLIIQSNKLK